MLSPSAKSHLLFGAKSTIFYLSNVQPCIAASSEDPCHSLQSHLFVFLSVANEVFCILLIIFQGQLVLTKGLLVISTIFISTSQVKVALRARWAEVVEVVVLEAVVVLASLVLVAV